MNIIKNIRIPIKSLPNKVEKFIIRRLDKNPPKSYAKISDSELSKIYKQSVNRFPSDSSLITDQLIKSIRSGYMKNHMITRHSNLKKNKDKIISDYKNGLDVLKISGMYDISPLNILREVFLDKYKTKLSKLILNPNLMSEYDYFQLKEAIDNDEYALIDNTQVFKDSIEFEKKIENFLKSNSIKYKSQEELTKEQIKSHGKPINTPDFLIKSDLYINGFKINWIDAKNFYGSKIPFVKDKIKRQTLKYLHEWGPGSIIFSLGFNEKLKFTNILFIDYPGIIDQDKT